MGRYILDNLKRKYREFPLFFGFNRYTHIFHFRFDTDCLNAPPAPMFEHVKHRILVGLNYGLFKKDNRVLILWRPTIRKHRIELMIYSTHTNNFHSIGDVDVDKTYYIKLRCYRSNGGINVLVANEKKRKMFDGWIKSGSNDSCGYYLFPSMKDNSTITGKLTIYANRFIR